MNCLSLGAFVIQFNNVNCNFSFPIYLFLDSLFYFMVLFLNSFGAFRPSVFSRLLRYRLNNMVFVIASFVILCPTSSTSSFFYSLQRRRTLLSAILASFAWRLFF